MSTQAQDRFNAAGTLFLKASNAPHAIGESPMDMQAVAGMARAAFERAEEINRQLFAEVELRVRQADQTAATLAGLQQAIADQQETTRIMLETIAGLTRTVRELAGVPAAIARSDGRH